MMQKWLNMAVSLKVLFLIGKKEKDDSDLSGQWHFPGGIVDVGEDFEQTVVREFQEETGLEVRISQKLGSNKKGEHVLHWFLLETDSIDSLVAGDDLVGGGQGAALIIGVDVFGAGRGVVAFQRHAFRRDQGEAEGLDLRLVDQAVHGLGQDAVGDGIPDLGHRAGRAAVAILAIDVGLV